MPRPAVRALPCTSTGLALSIVGYRAAAEDAVQETFITALTRLGELADPAAVGGWLHATLRNRCLMHLRCARRRREVADVDAGIEQIPDEARVEDRIESRQLRDWVWQALGSLPEAQRAAILLRYFASYESYDEIAAILGVPVGTIRSRLYDAKARLAERLLTEAGLARDDPAALMQERQAFLVETHREFFACGRCDALIDLYAPKLRIVWQGQRVTEGREHLVREMAGDYDDGVVMTPQRVLASGSLTVLEGRFRNPTEDPFHCPPGLALVMFHEGGRVTRMHLYLSEHPPREGDY